MRHGSLFSGIGGFDLAAEWMGWENVFHCENNTFCQKILKHYWPDATSYGDITKTDFSIHRGQIDIVTGGFPCQPYSVAGKRKGKEDDRHLWPEMLRAIREIQPSWIVGENVFGIVNWSGGMVFEQVQTDLEAEGYESQAYVLPACAKNAPHRRDRVWFVAHSRRDGHRNEYRENRQPTGKDKKNGHKRQWVWNVAEGNVNERIVTNANTSGCKERREEWITPIQFTQDYRPASEPGVRRGDNGLPYRVDRLRVLGNAVVPQVVYEIFKAIESYEMVRIRKSKTD